MENKPRLLTFLILVLIIGVPAVFILHRIGGQNIAQSSGGVVDSLVTVLLPAIAMWVLNALGVNIVDRVAGSIERFLRSLPAGYKRTYLKHLEQRFRVLEARGLTLGEHNLGLETAYVELKLAPRDSSTPREGKTIWDYLVFQTPDYQATGGRRLVIIGKPGTGKTTLLRNMILVMSRYRGRHRPRSAPDRLPVFLVLHEIEEALRTDPKLSLPKAVETLSDKPDKATPPHWFSSQLQKGRCIVLMDGLEEIPDQTARSRVRDWVQNQMADYPKNHFVVSSRPYGYDDNPLDNVKHLEILPLTDEQVDSFAMNWYLANGIARSGREDAGVRERAQESAQDLTGRIRGNKVLWELARKPLLLTMTASVHDQTGILPPRRVELFKEIFYASLRRRWTILSQNDVLGFDQILGVLTGLAYHMMVNELSDISRDEAISVIAGQLAAMDSKLGGDKFLRNIDEQTGLLLDEGKNRYAFAHRTFQEYLASVHICSDDMVDLEQALIGTLGNSWWAETTRLYASQKDATRIIKACLESQPPVAALLSLAIDCAIEAYEIQPATRSELQNVLAQYARSDDPRLRAAAAEAMIVSRIRWMQSIGGGCCLAACRRETTSPPAGLMINWFPA